MRAPQPPRLPSRSSGRLRSCAHTHQGHTHASVAVPRSRGEPGFGVYARALEPHSSTAKSCLLCARRRIRSWHRHSTPRRSGTRAFRTPPSLTGPRALRPSARPRRSCARRPAPSPLAPCLRTRSSPARTHCSAGTSPPRICARRRRTWSVGGSARGWKMTCQTCREGCGSIKLEGKTCNAIAFCINTCYVLGSPNAGDAAAGCGGRCSLRCGFVRSLGPPYYKMKPYKVWNLNHSQLIPPLTTPTQTSPP